MICLTCEEREATVPLDPETIAAIGEEPGVRVCATCAVGLSGVASERVTIASWLERVGYPDLAGRVMAGEHDDDTPAQRAGLQ